MKTKIIWIYHWISDPAGKDLLTKESYYTIDSNDVVICDNEKRYYIPPKLKKYKSNIITCMKNCIMPEAGHSKEYHVVISSR